MTDSSTHLLEKPNLKKPNPCPTLPKGVSFKDTVIYWLGIGLGSGLPKRMPGTWGTLGGLFVGILLLYLGFWLFLFITVSASVIGIWICQRTSELMQVHDDPHIVWDEWAGIWIAMLPLAYFQPTYQILTTNHIIFNNLLFLLIVFVLFRFFDIVKPFPISWVDKQVSGGLGIMLDDILAGIMAMIVFYPIVAYYPF